MPTVWLVYRYSLSRRTGKPDFATLAPVAAFPARHQALEYARAEQRRFVAGPHCERVRFAVRCHAGSLSAFGEARPTRVLVGERDCAFPVRGV